MRTLSIFLFTIFASANLLAQDITGKWYGLLEVQGAKLNLEFNISKTDSGYTSTLDIPAQNAKNLPVTNTIFENPNIKFEIENINVEYIGKLEGDEFIGVFRQFGHEFPLNLSKKAIEKSAISRPQEPQKPYPYHCEDVDFHNAKANISLAGTLTLPQKEGTFPAVILITGSGPQNRDQELMEHKPFWVISDYLTRNGIAVLRYDDRGVGESTGSFQTATSADFATDVESAIEYLKTRKEIDKKWIGLIGHSEGGIIAPMVASNSKDVSFIVLLAGSGLRGDKILLSQYRALQNLQGKPKESIENAISLYSKLYDIVIKSNNNKTLSSDLEKQISQSIKKDSTLVPKGITKERYTNILLSQLNNPWIKYFLKYNPATALEKIKCPVLALNGEKDWQVVPKENLTAIREALTKAGNKNAVIKEIPNLNHLFQECKTGLPDEYAKIEQTFSPLALEEITKWIKGQVK